MLPRAQEYHEIPEETVRIARAAFPKGSPYMRFRDELGSIQDRSMSVVPPVDLEQLRLVENVALYVVRVDLSRNDLEKAHRVNVDTWMQSP